VTIRYTDVVPKQEECRVDDSQQRWLFAIGRRIESGGIERPCPSNPLFPKRSEPDEAAEGFYSGSGAQRSPRPRSFEWNGIRQEV
jgi:hypothetical protein